MNNISKEVTASWPTERLYKTDDTNVRRTVALTIRFSLPCTKKAHRNKQYEFMLDHNRVAYKAIFLSPLTSPTGRFLHSDSRVVHFCSARAHNRVYALSGKNQQAGSIHFKEALQSPLCSQPSIFNAQTSFFCHGLCMYLV